MLGLLVILLVIVSITILRGKKLLVPHGEVGVMFATDCSMIRSILKLKCQSQQLPQLPGRERLKTLSKVVFGVDVPL